MSYLYVGLYKRFTNFYVHLEVPNTNVGEFIAYYYDKNDADWKLLPSFVDETENYTKSGFFFLDLPKDSNGNHLWVSNEVSGQTKFWIRLEPSVTHSAGTTLGGIAPLFSNDADLISERNNIVSKYASTFGKDGSWILKHEAARKDIVQRLRNGGTRKVVENENLSLATSEVGTYKDLTEYDFWDINQVRQASKYLVLSKIFKQELSDDIEDKFFALGNEFEKKYDDAMEVFFLSLDLDDDGEDDREELVDDRPIELVRQ